MKINPRAAYSDPSRLTTLHLQAGKYGYTVGRVNPLALAIVAPPLGGSLFLLWCLQHAIGVKPARVSGLLHTFRKNMLNVPRITGWDIMQNRNKSINDNKLCSNRPSAPLRAEKARQSETF